MCVCVPVCEANQEGSRRMYAIALSDLGFRYEVIYVQVVQWYKTYDLYALRVIVWWVHVWVG